MRILILNWRDIKNPTSGGAEILTHEIAKRWVLWGHDVTQFSSIYPGCLQEEVVDDVRIIRHGQPYTRYIVSSIHFLAFVYYQIKFKNTFDVVIDEVHGIPFFTPWYVKEKKIVLICEVAGDLWKRIFGTLFGTIGLFIEKVYLRFIYVNIHFLTISESTKSDLIKNAVDEKHITILPMGVTLPKRKIIIQKENIWTLLYVGRLSKSKGVEDAIMTLQYLTKTVSDAKLWIIGRGSLAYKEYLQEMVTHLGLAKNVKFYGFVSEDEKFNLMSKAHVLLHPSLHEGFGLTIPEAGIVNTPTVAYNVPGLRDIVKNGKNGILVSKNTPRVLAHEIQDLLSNKKKYEALCRGAKIFVQQYNWDNTARTALEVISSI